jgi:peptidoglycan/LPS O-acetylase OafA/YrhL
MRALAVLLVALNHANVSFLSGGYVGVDVFFVVSGYLITGILLREGFDRDGGAPGRISLRGFYARRVRRILPAASLTLVATCVAVFVVYDQARTGFLQTKVVLLDALAASLFYANNHFANTTTNYFAQASTTMPSPFQHFWSLSVEEQFYLVWAPVVACAFYICRRLTRRDLQTMNVMRVCAGRLPGRSGC